MRQSTVNLSKLVLALIVLSMVLPVFSVSAGAPGTELKTDLRGLWVATVVNIDYPSKPETDPEILKAEAIEILDYAQATGLNAVFFQVRPTADAFYKSNIFPWSKYLTGAQGKAPEQGFDPLEFWTDEAHKRGIELHAWVNPYRITKKTYSEKSHDFSSLDPSNPARRNPEWVVKHSDGNLYFDPGIPEVRKLIIDSVLEIIENYPVDGIHFDDYFYPGRTFNDAKTYEKYGKGRKSLEDWRRENVDTLIGDLSKAIKDASGHVRFGISPFGIWANVGTNPLGSDTRGLQSYYDHYADSRKWVKEGMIDYIAPQLYWNIGYAVADYGKLLAWWRDTVRETGVDLYIGQAAYRAVNTDPSSPWYGAAEIQRQLELNEEAPEVKGSIFFSYKPLAGNAPLSEAIKAYYGRLDDTAPAAIPVSISRPSEDIRTSLEQYYLNGASDPRKPLYLNGKLVENRSAKGYFGVLVPLSIGENTFTLSQGTSAATRVIHREAASAGPVKMSEADIPALSVFPQEEEHRMPGEKITLSCRAPIGSKVTVKIGGTSHVMSASAATAPGPGIYSTTYTFTYTVPSFSGNPRNIDLGAPVYTMNYQGAVKTQTAPAKIGAIMDNSPFYAEVEKEVIDTYEKPVSGNGAAFELYKGMTGYVTGMTGSYVRLSSGQWVRKTGVRLYTSNSQLKPQVKKAVYTNGEKWDSLSLEISSPTIATAAFDGSRLKLELTAAAAAKPQLPSDSLFSSAEVSSNGNNVQYTLTLKEGMRIDGYYVEKTDDGLNLKIKRHVKAENGDKPLSGKTIMLDPGHGGGDAGAIGPLGLNDSEKAINLKTALTLKTELEGLGARVYMTRTEDVAMSLEERLSASRKLKPDMFVSIHANSMNDNVDISKVSGFSVFYREALAKPLADAVYNRTVQELERDKKGVHKRNFYVTRGTWTPSILIESGFVPNPDEFEWLTDDNERALLAKSLSQSIAAYFMD